jgi:sucrose-phosphate synthase
MHIVMISVHGLIRGENLELGRDADTGGQITYVIELCKALSALKEVHRVDLLTRQIHAPNVSADYAVPVEPVCDKFNIIRIPFGPKRYLYKESLWQHMSAFVDNALLWLREEKLVPDVIHGHYADAGWASACLASILNKPHVFTGHSLGRVKQKGLLSHGMSQEKIEKRYKISTRIEAEEMALDNATMVMSSTHNEEKNQYALYNHYDPSRINVIAPGVELSRFFSGKTEPSLVYSVKSKVSRFLRYPHKPAILFVCRPEYKKNLHTLIKAYGESKELQERANLIIVQGVRDDIRDMPKNTRHVFSEMLADIDKYDLYGRVAYPKEVGPDEISYVFRMVARSNGVFVHPALEENFGLTLLEAASCSLPIVATKVGGPQEILTKLDNGLLIDPLDVGEITAAIMQALSDKDQWKVWAKNGLRGVKKNYSWEAHAKKYIRKIRPAIKKMKMETLRRVKMKENFTTFDRLLVCDIDNTLTGDASALKQLREMIEDANGMLGFGLATGRNLPLIKQALKEWKIPQPNFVICSVGTEILYGKRYHRDLEWNQRLNYRWNDDKVKEALAGREDLKLQPIENQNPYKVSYFIREDSTVTSHKIKTLLRKHNVSANVILSHQSLLDIVPVRCSKGLAVRFFANKWKIPFDRILVAGDSGNDISLLRGEFLGVVVGNYSSEVEVLRHEPRIFFSSKKYAHGVIDGIEQYKFLDEIITDPEMNNNKEHICIQEAGLKTLS